MSELNIKQKLTPLLTPARIIGTFSNRFFAAFVAMAFGYGIMKKFLNFETSIYSTIVFLMICIGVTAIWSYYLIKLNPPLLYRPMNKEIKSKLIGNRIFILIVLFALKSGFKSEIAKTPSVIFLFLNAIMSMAIISSIVTLVVLIFKKPVSKKYKRSYLSKKASKKK